MKRKKMMRKTVLFTYVFLLLLLLSTSNASKETNKQECEESGGKWPGIVDDLYQNAEQSPDNYSLVSKIGFWSSFGGYCCEPGETFSLSDNPEFYDENGRCCVSGVLVESDTVVNSQGEKIDPKLPSDGMLCRAGQLYRVYSEAQKSTLVQKFSTSSKNDVLFPFINLPFEYVNNGKNIQISLNITNIKKGIFDANKKCLTCSVEKYKYIFTFIFKKNDDLVNVSGIRQGIQFSGKLINDVDPSDFGEINCGQGNELNGTRCFFSSSSLLQSSDNPDEFLLTIEVVPNGLLKEMKLNTFIFKTDIAAFIFKKYRLDVSVTFNNLKKNMFDAGFSPEVYPLFLPETVTKSQDYLTSAEKVSGGFTYRLSPKGFNHNALDTYGFLPEKEQICDAESLNPETSSLIGDRCCGDDLSESFVEFGQENVCWHGQTISSGKTLDIELVQDGSFDDTSLTKWNAQQTDIPNNIRVTGSKQERTNVLETIKKDALQRIVVHPNTQYTLSFYGRKDASTSGNVLLAEENIFSQGMNYHKISILGDVFNQHNYTFLTSQNTHFLTIRTEKVGEGIISLDDVSLKEPEAVHYLDQEGKIYSCNGRNFFSQTDSLGFLTTKDYLFEKVSSCKTVGDYLCSNNFGWSTETYGIGSVAERTMLKDLSQIEKELVLGEEKIKNSALDAVSVSSVDNVEIPLWYSSSFSKETPAKLKRAGKPANTIDVLHGFFSQQLHVQPDQQYQITADAEVTSDDSFIFVGYVNNLDAADPVFPQSMLSLVEGCPLPELYTLQEYVPAKEGTSEDSCKPVEIDGKKFDCESVSSVPEHVVDHPGILCKIRKGDPKVFSFNITAVKDATDFFIAFGDLNPDSNFLRMHSLSIKPLQFKYIPTAECCSPTSCWSGDACVAAGSSTTLQSAGKVYACALDESGIANWVGASPKMDWNEKDSGFCLPDKCLLPNAKDLKDLHKDPYAPLSCVPSGWADAENHYCHNGEWSTRTYKTSLDLIDYLKRTKQGMYTLHCGTPDEVLNNLEYELGIEKTATGEASVQDTIVRSVIERQCEGENPECVSVCALQTGTGENTHVFVSIPLIKPVNISDKDVQNYAPDTSFDPAELSFLQALGEPEQVIAKTFSLFGNNFLTYSLSGTLDMGVDAGGDLHAKYCDSAIKASVKDGQYHPCGSPSKNLIWYDASQQTLIFSKNPFNFYTTEEAEIPQQFGLLDILTHPIDFILSIFSGFSQATKEQILTTIDDNIALLRAGHDSESFYLAQATGYKSGTIAGFLDKREYDASFVNFYSNVDADLCSLANKESQDCVSYLQNGNVLQILTQKQEFLDDALTQFTTLTTNTRLQPAKKCEKEKCAQKGMSCVEGICSPSLSTSEELTTFFTLMSKKSTSQHMQKFFGKDSSKTQDNQKATSAKGTKASGSLSTPAAGNKSPLQGTAPN